MTATVLDMIQAIVRTVLRQAQYTWPSKARGPSLLSVASKRHSVTTLHIIGAPPGF